MMALRLALRRLHDQLGRTALAAPLIRVFDNLHLKWVARERYEGRTAGRDYLELYAAVILPKTNGRVLDLGCGYGYLTYEIARRPEVTEVVGIDKITNFRCIHPKITYQTLDLAADPRLPGGFDVIVATDFIEHIPETAFAALLPGIRESLRDGGLFVGSTPPNPTAVDTFSGSPYHVREYQPPALHAHLERHFADVHVELRGAALMTWTARKSALS